MTHWLILCIAGLFEVAWAVGLKYSDNFTRPIPSLFTVIAMIASVLLLGHAMKHLPIGTAYAVWVGIGTVGTVISGVMLFQEAATPARLISAACIVVGIIGLKLAE